MAPEWKPSSYVFCRLGIPLIIALMGIPLWLLGGGVFAAFAVAAALLCYFSASRLSGEIAKAHEQKCFLDEQLIQSQKLASIGELSSGIAHEINNPLAIMGQEIEWARHLFDNKSDDPASMDEIRDSLREIGSQIGRCREITHKLLDFARKKEPLIQSVDVNKLVEDMAKLVEKEAIQNDIAIVRDYKKDLPQVRTDPPLLRQVVLNLLNNAAYAIGRRGEIRIASYLSENGALDLAVSDTGCGIPKENLARIFDPFFTTKPPGKGTGLGLSLCHGIMVRLGGSITVESEEGKGTTFTIHLPFEREAS
jgi:two-component system, NtrC family, sensor kinase